MPEQSCERCSAPFECRANDIRRCDCYEVELTDETRAFLKSTFFRCLCNNCLREINDKVIALQGQVFPAPGTLRENEHYYVENGLYVFTERYHMLRGGCCKSGCRHCPYGFKKIAL